MLLLDKQTRERLWRQLIDAVEDYAENVARAPVGPALDPAATRQRLSAFDFNKPLAPPEAVEFAVRNLWQDQLHTPHPGYYGMFNPAPTTMGIAADLLVAAFNPQLAAWSHSPFAAEVERHLVNALGEKFGYPPGSIEGALCAGGMEANHTAVLTALAEKVPGYGDRGVRAAPGQPLLYVTREAHDSFKKAARLCGLGVEAAVAVDTDDDLKMDVAALERAIARDRKEGRLPFLVVATIGTTSAGIVDPSPAIARVAGREGLWFHADAAWGGAAALQPGLRPVLAGVEQADSITFDAHKWFSVPMGAGIYLTRRPGILERTFRVSQSYMPREAEGLDIQDPFAHSMQWSRRFIGLKIFLSLAVAGWQGYAEAVAHMSRMGELLKRKLEENRWRIVNRTPLPLACFVDATRPEGDTADHLNAILSRVLASGKAWISVPRIGPDARPALRACITNYRTQESDLDDLLAALDQARKDV